MAPPTTSPISFSLKLLIDPKSNTLLFAEAGKDFVDFLFNIMSFPVATVVTLISKQGTPGSTGNIYESIENLGDSYMLWSAKKDSLLLPTPQCQNVITFLNQANKPLFSSRRGFVKEAVTFMVMDDLVVRPMTTQSMLTLFNKFNIKDMSSSLKEKVVGVGPNEGVELLRALMQSKTVLTDVFLAGKEPSVKHEAVFKSWIK